MFAQTRLAEGMYSVFMADWLRIWPKEQMLILRYEDYAENLESVMKGVFNFLGLAPLNQTDMEFVTHREAVNVGDMYDKVGHMLPQTKEILDDFYRPFVHKFAEILSDTRFLWLDKEH
ncbi:hypothetical protein BaRGS_00009134 [Batillaria attramentaria]|uniref:Sulfotransferase domain-containing protein n=1 Tax=Batillaria attramentaria TaxID=370345 RepID=A0ABD0LKH6_9CAEN